MLDFKSQKWLKSTLKWEILPHPLYSTDAAPSDLNLFRLMANQHFLSDEGVEKWIDLWIVPKGEYFFRDGIRKIWAKVVTSDGQYFEYIVHL